MKIKSSVVAFLGIVILLGFPFYQNTTTNLNYYEIVVNSFKATNAQKVALNIEGWAKIHTTGFSKEEMNEQFQTITKIFDIEYNPQVEDYQTMVNYHQTYQNGTTLIRISLQSLSDDDLEEGTFLGLFVEDTSPVYSDVYYSLVSEIFSSYKDQLDLGVTLVGAVNGQLSQDEKIVMANKVFKVVNAKKIEGINTESLLSYSGYTTLCNDYLKVAGNKININIGIRYHSIEDKTYINVGAPLIFQEY